MKNRRPPLVLYCATCCIECPGDPALAWTVADGKALCITHFEEVYRGSFHMGAI